MGYRVRMVRITTEYFERDIDLDKVTENSAKEMAEVEIKDTPSFHHLADEDVVLWGHVKARRI